MSTRGNSEEIFAMSRAFFRGVKLENRPSISDFRKMANFMSFSRSFNGRFELLLLLLLWGAAGLWD